jgi:hypothetical protein
MMGEEKKEAISWRENHLTNFKLGSEVKSVEICFVGTPCPISSSSRAFLFRVTHERNPG